MWQDYVIGFTSFVLMIGLVPQVIYNFKYKLCEITFRSSVPAGSALLVMGTTFATIPLHISAVTAIITSILWFVIVFQRVFYR